MKTDPKNDLPPYFNIDPDTALGALGGPFETGGFARIAQACEATDIVDFLDRDIASLSGGQRQRVWLALALAQDTPVLLLDEPTTFLDPAHAMRMLELARAQAQAGKTVVVVLHDLMLAGHYSDSMVVMKAGDIIARGAPKQVLSSKVLAQAYGIEAEAWEDPLGDAPIIVPRRVVAAH